MAFEVEEKVTCCCASQDRVWATAPDGEKWEYYTVLSNVDERAAGESSATAVPCCTAVA
jgi:lactoylglutathione lyase